MDKSTSDNGSRPRRSPRTGTTEMLMNIKKNMKQKTEGSSSTTYLKDDYEVAQSSKDLVKNCTGVIYDEEFAKNFWQWDEDYPESPERCQYIVRRCEELGLFQSCRRIPIRPATENEVLQVHTKELLDFLKATDGETNFDVLEEKSSKYDSVHFNGSTYQTASYAVGAAIDLVDAICVNEIQNGMAIVRPPGHHAMKNEFCGYCFFNNVAIAAKHALKKRGCDRILIVDWDVHHGQGIQQMFYDEPRIIYFSIHRYEHGKFWPELRESEFDYIGEKSARGFNFNVPLNSTGLTDADYLAIFQQILIPVAYEYEPELIIVSAGYDAAIGCPEGQMNISPACFAHLTNMLMSFAKGKVAVILEGGYNLKSLSESAALTLRTLMGHPVPALHSVKAPSECVVQSILNVIYVQRPYWQCLRLQDTFSINPIVPEEKGEKDLEARKHIPKIKFAGETEKPKPTVYETRNCYPVLSPVEIQRAEEALEYFKKITDLSIPLYQMGLSYDERMLEHKPSALVDHPEKPERVSAIFEKCVEFGILNKCYILRKRQATQKDVMLVHDPEYVQQIMKVSDMKQEELTVMAKSYDSVYLHPKTYECALTAAGALLQVVEEVVNRTILSGVAIIRPPGHHAEQNAACGFCFFNNVAIAAKHALRLGVQRVLIVDWDVHHGNGTQRIFESSNKVLYISLHRYDNGKFFPSSTDGNYDKVGIGEGEGFNVNIPWNKPGAGMGDAEYIAAFQSVVMPIAYQFDPELVLVSAGFDACVNDPIGNYKLTPEVFAHMTFWLKSLANGRIVLALEGGYNITSTAYAMTLCVKVLMGDPLPPLTSAVTPCDSALETLKNVIATHEKYWSCLKFNRLLPKEDGVHNRALCSEENLHENENKINKKDDDIDTVTKTLTALNVEGAGAKNQTADYKSEGAKGGGRRPDRRRQPSRDSDGQNASGAAGRTTLMEYLSENRERLLNQEMFAVVPLPGCPHLSEVQQVPSTGIDVMMPCVDCDSSQENWICLICYSVHCGRYVNEHMVQHNQVTRHPLTLSFTDLSVWCYVCEAYIDNMVLYPAKNAVHRSKFGSDLAWSYGDQQQRFPGPKH